jgi:hypothetical protein
VVLCQKCYGEAVEARKKIVVEDDGEGNEVEDDSALSDEERELAAYIATGIEGACRQSRELISGYPRDERRQLHRYQDQIDRDRRNSGKSRR